jgi:PAS domain S-box-containing protein
MINEFHPKLEEQINSFIGQNSRLKKKIAGFLSVINSTYQEQEEKLRDRETLLSKYETTLLEKGILTHQNQVLNNEVQLKDYLIHQNKVQISNFEKLSNAGSFKFNLKSGIMINSNQMSHLFDVAEYEYNIAHFTSLFVEANLINEAISNCKLTKSSILFEEIKLIDEDKFFSINGEVINEKGDEILQVVVKDLTSLKKHEHELENAILNLEFYKSVIDQTVILSMIHVDGKISFVNDKYADISGYSNLEMIGKSFNFLMFDAEKEATLIEINETLKINDNWKGIIKYKGKNDNIFWLDTTIIPFISEEKIKKFISVQLDVTDKILKEEKEEKQRSFYETILNNLPLDIAVFNDKHEYLYVNPVAIKNTEIRKFIIGKTDFDYCRHFNKELSIAEGRQIIFNQVLESKKQLEFTDKLVSKEGKDVYVLRKFFPFLNQENEMEYMLGVGLDVTEKTVQSIQIKKSLLGKNIVLKEEKNEVKNRQPIFPKLT